MSAEVGTVVEVILVGSETCHRYQRMREMLLEESARLGLQIKLVEENEVQGILKYSTVNLPLLFIGGEMTAQVNPSSRARVQQYLSQSTRASAQ
jgi:hypothetical protein